MKLLRRFLSIFCIAALLLTAVPAILAQTSPTLYFTDSTVTIGGSSSYCYLKMDDAENISAMDYMIIYDPDNLELASINNTGFTAASDVTIDINSSEPGIIRVTLISQNGINGSGYLNLMYFKATENAVAGTYPISVVVNDIYDSSLETVIASKQSGTITVKEPTQTTKKVSFSASLSDTSVEIGENVTYKLSASSLNGLSAGTFDVTYDETKLKLDGVTLSSAIESTVYDINDTIDGLVKVSFASETAITSGTNLAVLDFSAIAAGTASIDFKPSALYDYEFTEMTGSELSHSVTVTEPEVVVDNADLWVEIPENITSDKEFSVQVILQGGSGVCSGDFVVGYDSSVLECLGVTQETVSGAWLVTDKNYSGGQVRFSFMSSTGIEEDAALVTITLKSTENIDSKSSITVVGSGVYDADFNEVPLEYIGAEIKAVRPEYTVNFYDSDGETLLSTQKVMSGNSAIPPKMTEIRNHDNENHMRFNGWNKEYSMISDDTDLVAVYEEEAHTVITQPGTAATCTEAGLSEGRFCVVCETVLEEQTVIPASSHTEVATPDIAPGFNTPGYAGGTQCSICGEVLTQPSLVPPTGTVANASLDPDGVLTVSGALSDSVSTEGTTLIAVYDSCGRLLNVIDITAENQSNFNVQIFNCSTATTVKILRWDAKTLAPLSDVIAIDLTQEQ